MDRSWQLIDKNGVWGRTPSSQLWGLKLEGRQIVMVLAESRRVVGEKWLWGQSWGLGSWLNLRVLLAFASFGGLYPFSSQPVFCPIESLSLICSIQCPSAVGCLRDCPSGPFWAGAQDLMKPEDGSNFFIWLNGSSAAEPEEDNDPLSQRMGINCLEG